MKRFKPIILAALVLAFAAACSDPPAQNRQDSGAEQTVQAVQAQTVQLDQTRQKAEDYRIGPVKINPHPASLEGKTIVLRWNGKFNGDIVLDRLAELLIKNVPGVRVVKMWLNDPSTATTSYNTNNTALFSERIAALKPDLVIASSADGDRCSAWLTIDQLNLEKRGIPTLTITTDVFETAVTSTMKTQGISGMTVVAVEHPIAGRNAEDTVKLVDAAFSDILTAATQRQPNAEGQ